MPVRCVLQDEKGTTTLILLQVGTAGGIVSLGDVGSEMPSAEPGAST